MGRQHQGIDRPEVRQVPESSGEQGKMEETGCEIVCGAPTTLGFKAVSYTHLTLPTTEQKHLKIYNAGAEVSQRFSL